jgi:hypothetical protein
MNKCLDIEAKRGTDPADVFVIKFLQDGGLASII